MEPDRRGKDPVVKWMIVLVVVTVLGWGVIGTRSLLNTNDLANQEDITRAIQQSRETTIFSACVEQNKRNVAAGVFLQSLPPSPSQPKRTPEETEKLLHGFTDALVGRRYDCFKRTAQLTR